jgi:hypothetical protein
VAAIYLDAALVLVSALLYLGVRRTGPLAVATPSAQPVQ